MLQILTKTLYNVSGFHSIFTSPKTLTKTFYNLPEVDSNFLRRARFWMSFFLKRIRIWKKLCSQKITFWFFLLRKIDNFSRLCVFLKCAILTRNYSEKRDSELKSLYLSYFEVKDCHILNQIFCNGSDCVPTFPQRVGFSKNFCALGRTILPKSTT